MHSIFSLVGVLGGDQSWAIFLELLFHQLKLIWWAVNQKFVQTLNKSLSNLHSQLIDVMNYGL